MSHNKVKKNHQIQIYRGIAVTLVVLFHLFPQEFPYGFLGVDIFFAISGFLLLPKMIEFHSKDNFYTELKSFLRKRIIRVLPAFYVMLVIFIPLSMFLDYPNSHMRFLKIAFSGVLGVANFAAYSISGDYFGGDINSLNHIWSLSAEEQCYLLLPILIYFAFVFTRRKLTGFRALIFLSIIFFVIQTILIYKPTIYNYFGIRNSSVFSYYSPLPRLIEFSLGGIFALSKVKKVKFLIIFIFGVWIFILKLLQNSQTTTGLLVVLFFLAIFFRFKNFKGPHTLLNTLSWLGDRSYSIYLYHLPIYAISQIYFNSLFSKVLTLLLLLLASHFSYIKVEKFYLDGFNIGKKFEVHKLFLVANVMILFFVLVIRLNYLGLATTKRFIEYDGTGSDTLNSFMNVNCPRVDPCKLNSFSSNRILLVGDSRAEMYSRVIYHEAKEFGYGLDIWTSPGCRIYFENATKEDQFGACYKRNLGLKELLKSNKYEKIIVAEAIYSKSNMIFMKNALKLLASSSKNVYLFRDIPLFQNERFFLTTPPLIIWNYVPKDKILRTSINDENRVFQNDIYTFAQNLRIHLIDPSKALCDEVFCYRYKDSQWLYHDASHLSSFGAEKVRIEILQKVFIKTRDGSFN